MSMSSRVGKPRKSHFSATSSRCHPLDYSSLPLSSQLQNITFEAVRMKKQTSHCLFKVYLHLFLSALESMLLCLQK